MRRKLQQWQLWINLQNITNMELLLMLLLSISCSGTQSEFLLTAPSVFHVGVKERISSQLDPSLLNKPLFLYLEHERSGRLMSARVRVPSDNTETNAVELEVDMDKLSQLPSSEPQPFYLMLVFEMSSAHREMVRVLVSQHRGYIFIQTDQPIYNPTQTVKYRIFTLNHAMLPHDETVFLSIFNAGGNRVMLRSVKPKDGIFSSHTNIPDVSEPGTWKIVAHFAGDQRDAVTREFQVQKFVMPSFEVSIHPEESYYLLGRDQFTFTIHAKYSYGEPIRGAFHCRFGVREDVSAEGKEEGKKTTIIRGLEKMGAITNGGGHVTLVRSQLDELLKNFSTDVQKLTENRAQLYAAVSVTDVASGELQEAEVALPIVSHKYSVDLSRTRSHFIPGVPFHIVVMVKLPNGSPAAKVKVSTQLLNERQEGNTDKHGIAEHIFNWPKVSQAVLVTVSIDGKDYEKTYQPASSPSNSFLHISLRVTPVAPGRDISFDLHVVGDHPGDGRIHYLVVSKGMLQHQGTEAIGVQARVTVRVQRRMAPSFRLIAYFYHTSGEIVTDSVWVNVNDGCEGTISLSSAEMHMPGDLAELDIDLHGQEANVALLAVDKAIYALKSDNKLTSQQLLSSMQSYDLGCSYGGGRDAAQVLNDAGLSFITDSKTTRSSMRKGLGCETGFRRQKRSPSLQELLNTKASSYTDVKRRRCCETGMTLMPMPLTCEERGAQVARHKDESCVSAFLECCKEANRLRELKARENPQSSQSRVQLTSDIEDFFDMSVGNIRRSFPPSFAFQVVPVSEHNMRHLLFLPDSITTWEIQAVSLSSTHGICVAEPYTLRAFKKIFVSLRLPYSVRRYEQLAVVGVIYNYGNEHRELSVHMKPAEGLCAPGTASIQSHFNITLAKKTSQTVTFSVVPMTTGKIPITLLVYDTLLEMRVDAIEKQLLVMTEGVVQEDEETHLINMDGRSSQTLVVDGNLPNRRVPESDTNIFAKIEEMSGGVFSQTSALPLLSPEGVQTLLRAPMGCAEQTMIRMSPTTLALQYLDHTNGWMELPVGTRDVAMKHVEAGYSRILTFKKPNHSYGAWLERPTSNWLTALVVKVTSLVADRQLVAGVDSGRQNVLGVSMDELEKTVAYLLSQQNQDGSFSDPTPVIHREMQGGVGEKEGDVSLTAFITIALNHSLHHLSENPRNQTETSIKKAITFIRSRFDSLERPYSMAIAAYCLSVCGRDEQDARSAWDKLKTLATKEGECRVWRSLNDMRQPGEVKWYSVPPAEAITVETTAYGLLTSIAHQELDWADSAACWLSQQENYGGGFRSTQDTIVALEALSQLAMSRPSPPMYKVSTQFSVPGKSQVEKASLDRRGEKVEVELKRLLGNEINVVITGSGKVKVKVVKAYHVLKADDSCELLSINVKVKGKVQYTGAILSNYYYDDHFSEEDRRDEEEERDFPRSEIEWFDARSRRRRDTEQSRSNQELVTYQVCIRHSLSRNLSGMAVADITLLSGFEADREDLEKLKNEAERYISHYETEFGRVILYLDEIPQQCIMFGAVQRFPVGLVQPAPATVYDYYEPDRRCTTFYSAPHKSKQVSTLCYGDVCQCAEKPCYVERKTPEATKKQRIEFACYSPTVSYSYKVQVHNVSRMNSFELYHTTVTDVLRSTGDHQVSQGSCRVFVKRQYCKGKLELGNNYLIMGQDSPVTDSSGLMQYLLDSATWVERLPSEEECLGSRQRRVCNQLNSFLSTYQLNGCTQ